MTDDRPATREEIQELLDQLAAFQAQIQGDRVAVWQREVDRLRGLLAAADDPVVRSEIQAALDEELANPPGS